MRRKKIPTKLDDTGMHRIIDFEALEQQTEDEDVHADFERNRKREEEALS